MKEDDLDKIHEALVYLNKLDPRREALHMHLSIVENYTKENNIVTYTKEDLLGDLGQHEEYGQYINYSDVEKFLPAILEEWDKWLDCQRGPGNYDEIGTFMPAHLCKLALTLLK